MSANKPPFDGEWVRLNQLCMKGRSALRQKDLIDDGPYAVYGASGIIGSMSTFQNSARYVAVVKDGAGVGRVNLCSARTSVLGTMQALIPTEMVLPEYLLHLIRAMRLGDGFSGSTIPHIYFKDYGQRLVRYVSMADQERIVGTLGSIEDQIDILHQQKERLDTLVKSRFVEMFGDPIDGSLWVKSRLSELYEVKSSKRIYARDQVDEGVPFLRLADIGALIDSGTANSGLFISEEHFEGLKAKGQVPAPGDVLVTARGTLGRCYVIKSDDRFYFQDGMITWLAASEDCLLSDYLLAVFNNSHFNEELNRNCSGTTVKYLSISDLANMTVPVPPFALQQEFASFVAEVDKSRFIVQQKIEKLQTLYDSLAQEYFG